MIHACPCGHRRFWAFLTTLCTICLGPALLVSLFYTALWLKMGSRVLVESTFLLVEEMDNEKFVDDIFALYRFNLPPAIVITVLGFIQLFSVVQNHHAAAKLSIIVGSVAAVFSIIMFFVILLLSTNWIESLPLSIVIMCQSYFTWVFCEYEHWLHNKLNGVEKISSMDESDMNCDPDSSRL